MPVIRNLKWYEFLLLPHICSLGWLTKNGTSLTLHWWGPEGKTRHSERPVSAKSASVLYINLHIIYCNHNFTMVGKVIGKSELTGREVTTSPDTSAIIALLSREMWRKKNTHTQTHTHTHFTQLITGSKWEKGFMTGKLAGPPFYATLDVASDKSKCLYAGNKGKFDCDA